MHDHLVEKRSTGHPQTTPRRVHYLNERAVTSPRDDEMGSAVGAAHDRDGRHDRRLAHEHVIERNKNLLRTEAELLSDDFEGVDRCPIDIRLTRFAKPAIARANMEALKKRLDRRRTAVDGRRLDNFRNEKPAAVQRHAALPGGW